MLVYRRVFRFTSHQKKKDFPHVLLRWNPEALRAGDHTTKVDWLMRPGFRTDSPKPEILTASETSEKNGWLEDDSLTFGMTYV